MIVKHITNCVSVFLIWFVQLH